MKKQLLGTLLIFVFLLTMTGCSAVNAARKLDAVEEMVEIKLDAAREHMEDVLRDAAAPLPAEGSQILTGEQALQIALDYLGFTADQVTRIRTEYEVDDGVPEYKISFYWEDWEYELEIHGENGKILSYDKDHKYD